MRITKKIYLPVVAALAVLSPLMAGRAQAQFNGDSSTTRRPQRFLEAQITTDRTQYNGNRAVQVSLIITNLGQYLYSARPNGYKDYDFSVRDSRSNKIVYTLSKHRQLPTRGYTIAPGETRTYPELWDRRDDRGERLRSGVYVIEGKVWPQEMISTQIYLGEGGRPGGGGGDDDGGNGGNGPRPKPDPDPAGDYRSVRGTIQMNPRRAAPGETVNLSYTVRNATRQNVTVRFNSSQQFEFAVRERGNRPLWTSSQGMMYTQALTALVLRPGQEKTYDARWRVPQNVREGSYEVTAQLSSRDEETTAAATATLRIDRKGNGNGGDYGGGVSGDSDGNGGGRDDSNGSAPDNPYGGGQSGGGNNDGGNGGGFTLGSGGVNAAPQFVSLRELASPRAGNYVGQRVTVSAMYNGSQGASGPPPVGRNDWVIASEGVMMYVSGTTPTAPIGRRISVVGTVRRANNGRIYLQSN